METPKDPSRSNAEPKPPITATAKSPVTNEPMLAAKDLSGLIAEPEPPSTPIKHPSVTNEKSVRGGQPRDLRVGGYACCDDRVDYWFRCRDVFRKVLEEKDEMIFQGSGNTIETKRAT